jgi:hypothetical protein
MELVRFRENIYGRLQNQLFLWEPTWDSFRPFERYAWNGSSFEHVFIRTDIWDPFYGYGSSEMMHLCKKLLEETELETATDVSTFDAFWTWCRTPTEWLRDRRCAFTSCAIKDAVSWKRMIASMHSKPKTIRHRIHSRATKRMNRFIRK